MNNTNFKIVIAKRMMKLCNSDNNAAEAMAFIHDAITLMELTLKEEEV